MTRFVVAVAILGLLSVIVGCESEFQPKIQEDLVVQSHFIEWSTDNVDIGVVPILDGTANNLEWGSPDDPARPYSYVQLTAENGFGDPGASKFIAIKSAYTGEWNPITNQYIIRNVYFLFQWADLSLSAYANSFIWEGADFEVLHAQIVARCMQDTSMSQNDCEDIADDSLSVLLYDVPGQRPRPENWSQIGGDDRLAIAIGDGLASAGRQEFKNFGCQVACHSDDAYGPVEDGFLDVWLWSASKTNPLHEAFNPGDIGGDASPIEGFCGYADDYFVNDSDVLTQDSGPVLWIPNFDPDAAPEERYPLRVWMRACDVNQSAQGTRACESLNMGMDFPWLQRGSTYGCPLTSDASSLVNQVVFNWDSKERRQARRWQRDDFVSGYLLGHDYQGSSLPSSFSFCLPGCFRSEDPPNCEGNPYETHEASSIQVRAHGRYSGVSRHWVLEMAREAGSAWGNTQGGLFVEDIDFDRLRDVPRDFHFAVALWNEESGAHWGSPPIRLHFDPPPPREVP